MLSKSRGSVRSSEDMLIFTRGMLGSICCDVVAWSDQFKAVA